jgi:hypothetical protein
MAENGKPIKSRVSWMEAADRAAVVFIVAGLFAVLSPLSGFNAEALRFPVVVLCAIGAIMFVIGIVLAVVVSRATKKS